jgi:putative transposase
VNQTQLAMNYTTDLSNSQWQVISKFLNLRRRRKYDLRKIVNAILYLIKTGCQWRMLPKDLPKWGMTYYYFRSWKKQGIIEKIHNALVKLLRKGEGRKGQPTAAIIDAQSTKATLVSGESRGYDAGKKVKGIKRHIIVDTMGLILAVVIQSASLQDRDGAKPVIEKLKGNWKRITKMFGDGGYRGKLIEWTKEKAGIDLEIVKRNELSKFKVLPKRWVVERTLSWLDTNRRNSKFYERLDETGIAMVHCSAIRIMLNRL